MTSQGEGPVAPLPAKPFAQPDPPPKELVRAVAGPLWRRRNVIGKVIAALLLAPGLLAQIQAIPGLHLATWVTHGLLIAGSIGWFLSSLLSSVDSSDSAARAALRGPGDCPTETPVDVTFGAPPDLNGP